MASGPSKDENYDGDGKKGEPKHCDSILMMVLKIWIQGLRTIPHIRYAVICSALIGNYRNFAPKTENILYITSDTIVALSTPQGEGAIGVIRLSGKEAIRICDDIFFGKKLSKQDSHTAHFGTIKDDGRTIDEVLITIFKNPKSYTGEDVCEISCHGSSYIINQIISLCIRKGARTAQPGEFTLRAFMNGKMDLSQAEAVADLIASESAAGHDVAMKQMRGGVAKEISHLRQELIDFAALMELELDFGEEDVEFADRGKLKNLIHTIQSYIRKLMDSFLLGNAIKKGINTVIAGRPNAGKSTLLNALLNEERAIVSDIAGTTRDTIEETLNINGITFRLIDTAGIRDATDQIEAIGVQKTFEKVRQSSILVYVYDFMEMETPEIFADIQQLYSEGMKGLIIANKMDIFWSMHANARKNHEANHYEKSKAGNWNEFKDKLKEMGFDSMHLSAKNENAGQEVKEKLFGIFMENKDTQSDTIISNARHYDALHHANESLGQALENLEQGISGDFIAMDIRHALRYLGEITGEISSDDLLESIFSRFCIGK